MRKSRCCVTQTSHGTCWRAHVAGGNQRGCRVKHSQKVLPPKVLPSCKVDRISRSTKINDVQCNMRHYHRDSRELKTQENNITVGKAITSN